MSFGIDGADLEVSALREWLAAWRDLMERRYPREYPPDPNEGDHWRHLMGSQSDSAAAAAAISRIKDE
jgi:hypothetical protein